MLVLMGVDLPFFVVVVKHKEEMMIENIIIHKI